MYRIRFAQPHGVQDLERLPVFYQRIIIDDAKEQLTVEPMVPSRRRKFIEDINPNWPGVIPFWELVVRDYRAFYDVDEESSTVWIRAIRFKGRSPTEEIT